MKVEQGDVLFIESLLCYIISILTTGFISNASCIVSIFLLILTVLVVIFGENKKEK